MKEFATIHFDGGGQSPGLRAACVVELGDGSVVQAVRSFDQGTHNIAEYQALILGLHLALNHGERNVVAMGDSSVVVKQVEGEWETKEPALLPLRTQVEELLKRFDSADVKWIPREQNRRADELGRGVMSLELRGSTGDP